MSKFLKFSTAEFADVECVDHLYFVKTSSNSSSLSDDNPWVFIKTGYTD